MTDAEVIKLAALFTRVFPATLSQNLTVHQATALAAAVTLIQRLKITPAHIPQTEFHLALAQAILASSTLADFFGIVLSQAMTVHAGLTRVYRANPLLTARTRLYSCPRQHADDPARQHDRHPPASTSHT